MRFEVNERGMLVKRFLTSNDTIVWLAKLWFEILERKVKVSAMLMGCCLRFARDCYNHLARS